MIFKNAAVIIRLSGTLGSLSYALKKDDNDGDNFGIWFYYLPMKKGVDQFAG
jgi:hypothetical protein